MAALTRRGVSVTLSGLIVWPLSVLALGTFLPGLSYLHTVGSYVFPSFAGPFLLLALGGIVLALIASRSGARRSGRAFAVIGTVTTVAAGAIIGRHAQVASANGASVNVFMAVVPRGAGTGAAPDATRIYTRADGRDLKLDIYRPADRTHVLLPVAIHIHGGGWIREDRTSKAANLRWLADHGFLAVSLDYGLATATSASWQTATAQVACGMTWVAANIAEYGGDPARLFAFGESAGGALALTTTYAAAGGVANSSCAGTVPIVRAVAAMVPAVDPVSFYQDPDPITGGFARQMVRWYLGGTPMDYPDRARAVSSATYITPQAPPTLITLSDNDHLVPIAGALQFIDRAEHAGVPLRIVRFPWADHGVAVQYYSVVNQAWLLLMRRHFCRYGGACA